MDAHSAWEYPELNLSNRVKREASATQGGDPTLFRVVNSNLLDDLVDVNPSLEGMEFSTLSPFDTICLRTVNSEYRILLLDPKQGRALVEGGPYFAEPIEATLSGSTFGGSTLKVGWIGVGLRLEIWTNGKWTRTSPVQSILVTSSSAEPVPTNAL